MRKSVLLAIGLSLALAPTAWAYTVGVYADAAGTSCDLPSTLGVPQNWYVVAKLAPGEDLSGFEFQITGLTGDVIFLGQTFEPDVLWIPASGATTLFNGGGAGVFTSCKTSPTALIATVLVLPLTSGAGTLDVVAVNAPSVACGSEPNGVTCDVSPVLFCGFGGQAFFNQTGCKIPEIFSDGFESGNTTAWSSAVGVSP